MNVHIYYNQITLWGFASKQSIVNDRGIIPRLNSLPFYIAAELQGVSIRLSEADDLTKTNPTSPAETDLSIAAIINLLTQSSLWSLAP